MQLTITRIGETYEGSRETALRMYVCICNALKDSQLKQAAQGPGVSTPACVFKQLDARPQCGRCLPDVHDMISATEIRASDSQVTR